MENQLQIFVNKQFGEIRTVMIEGEPYFVGKDVATALGYKDTINALKTHVKDNHKLGWQITTSGQRREMTVIDEAGLYSLIMRSSLPDAEKFQEWVTAEVLPTIRKHGVYATELTLEKMIASPDFAISLLQALKNERAENEKLKNTVEVQAVQIAEMKPKANYYDLILQSKEALPISVIAKDYGYSPQAFNKLLRDMRIQYKLKSGTWLVYQKYAKEGYTCTKSFPLDSGLSVTHTYWTQKGRLFLYHNLKNYSIIPLMERQVDNE